MFCSHGLPVIGVLFEYLHQGPSRRSKLRVSFAFNHNVLSWRIFEPFPLHFSFVRWIEIFTSPLVFCFTLSAQAGLLRLSIFGHGLAGYTSVRACAPRGNTLCAFAYSSDLQSSLFQCFGVPILELKPAIFGSCVNGKILGRFTFPIHKDYDLYDLVIRTSTVHCCYFRTVAPIEELQDRLGYLLNTAQLLEEALYPVQNLHCKAPSVWHYLVVPF